MVTLDHKIDKFVLTKEMTSMRMGRDSNPRGSSPTAFQVPRLRPLGHPSITKSHKRKGNNTVPIENNIVAKK